MKELLEQIRMKAIAEIEASENTEELRVKYLGKKGELTAVLRGMGKVSPEERPIIGQLANEVRATIEAALSEKAELQKKKELERRLLTEKLDVTLPGKVQHRCPPESGLSNQLVSSGVGQQSLTARPDSRA